MSGPKGESRFWEGLFPETGNCWSVSPGNEAAVPGRRSDDLEVMVYVIDAQSGWIMAGAFVLDEMEAARRLLVAQGAAAAEASLGLVVNMTRSCAREAASDTSPIAKELVGLAMTVATVSPAFAQVITDRGGVEGHWMVFVYTAASGKSSAHVSFVASSGKGFLNRASFEAASSMVLKSNLQMESATGRAMSQGGGVVLSPMFRALLDR
ncbi:hypothetical protein [Ottowia sp.]|uniref:hypothetical protein n=1 Tax=Ottowia sp. TaxID=1898956 RepID=UPI0025EA4D6B|nr:hypothetical protein [Ottowia sp.]MBK6616453.1 hypothetical protein [Ottowia sp.]